MLAAREFRDESDEDQESVGTIARSAHGRQSATGQLSRFVTQFTLFIHGSNLVGDGSTLERG